MEARDVALLGFVSAAQKYVDKHINEKVNLGDLENVDIKKLKDELSAQLKFLAMSNEKKADLISSGEKAFDEYVIENLEPKRNIIDELGQIFDVSFDDFDVKPIESTDNIDNLLDAYDIDENIEVTSTINKTDEPDELDLKTDNIESIIPDNNVSEPDEFGLSADDDVLLTIANAAAKSDEELARLYKQSEVKEPDDLDATFADVVNNEVEEQNEDQHIPLSEVLRNINKNIEQTGYYSNEESQNVNIKPKETKETTSALSGELKNIGNATQQPINIIVNPGLDIVLKQEEQGFYDVSQEEERVTIEDIEIIDEDEDYTLSEALAGLGKLQKKQESVSKIPPQLTPQVERYYPKQEKAVNNDEKIYSNIMIAYPYLSRSFVVSAYSQKDEIARSYKHGDTYIILHRLSFTYIEELHEFVEIMMAHNYLVNVDEKKMIVDTIREFTNREGVILTNIFSIANQAKILNGEYEGYRVLDKEGK